MTRTATRQQIERLIDLFGNMKYAYICVSACACRSLLLTVTVRFISNKRKNKPHIENVILTCNVKHSHILPFSCKFDVVILSRFGFDKTKITIIIIDRASERWECLFSLFDLETKTDNIEILHSTAAKGKNQPQPYAYGCSLARSLSIFIWFVFFPSFLFHFVRWLCASSNVYGNTSYIDCRSKSIIKNWSDSMASMNFRYRRERKIIMCKEKVLPFFRQWTSKKGDSEKKNVH